MLQACSDQQTAIAGAGRWTLAGIKGQNVPAYKDRTTPGLNKHDFMDNISTKTICLKKDLARGGTVV